MVVNLISAMRGPLTTQSERRFGGTAKCVLLILLLSRIAFTKPADIILGTLDRAAVPSSNSTVYVDGSFYPFTSSGLQKAIDAACNGTIPGRVLIPPNQTIAATASIPNNCTVEGEGSGSMIQSSANAPILTNANVSANGISIKNLRVDGGSSSNGNNHGIYFAGMTNPTDIVLDGVQVSNVGGYGISIYGTPSAVGDRLTIRNTKVLNAGLSNQAQLWCYNVTNISDVEMTDDECTGAGVVYGIVSFGSNPTNAANATRGVAIKGAQIHDIGQNICSRGVCVGGGGTGIDIGRVRGVSISSSNFRNIASGQAICLESVWSGTVSGNTTDGTVIPSAQSTLLIKQPDNTVSDEVGSSNITISSNSFYQPGGGVSVVAANGSMKGITFVGNTVLMDTTAGVGGFLMQPGSTDAKIVASGWGEGIEITVIGNVITNLAPLRGNKSSGINIVQPYNTAVDQIIISNNAIRGTNEGIIWQSISVTNGITHMYIHDNALEGNNIGFGANDVHNYDSVYYWNNLPPNRYGTQSSFMPPVSVGRLRLLDQGQCKMSAGACAPQRLSQSYGTAPNCQVTWTGVGTLAGKLRVSATTFAVSPESSTRTDTAVVNWVCFGN